jgi:hypothetical protein
LYTLITTSLSLQVFSHPILPPLKWRLSAGVLFCFATLLVAKMGYGETITGSGYVSPFPNLAGSFLFPEEVKSIIPKWEGLE